MKSTLLLAVLISFPAFAKGKLEAKVINSPVKESHVKVQLQGVDPASKVLFKPKNEGQEVEGEVVQENGILLGKFKTSQLPVGNYEYRIRITTKSGSSKNDNAIAVDFVTFSIDSSLEVADPGEEGKKTLAGIDSDKDGVRDDVQRWINESYPMSKLPSTNQALKQEAKSMQVQLINHDNKEISQREQIKGLEDVMCLVWIKGAKSAGVHSKLNRAKFYNTPDRIKALFRTQEYARGNSSPQSIKEKDFDDYNQFCEFKATKEQ